MFKVANKRETLSLIRLNGVDCALAQPDENEKSEQIYWKMYHFISQYLGNVVAFVIFSTLR